VKKQLTILILLQLAYQRHRGSTEQHVQILPEIAVGHLTQRFVRAVVPSIDEQRVQGWRDLRECVEQPRIEVAVTALLQNIYRFIIAKRFLAGAARSEGIEDIDDGDNARRQRDGVTPRPFG
jgi:hypothetical protein